MNLIKGLDGIAEEGVMTIKRKRKGLFQLFFKDFVFKLSLHPM